MKSLSPKRAGLGCNPSIYISLHSCRFMGFGKDGKGQILWGRSSFTVGVLPALDLAANGDGYTAIGEDFRILRTDYFMSFEPQATGDILLVGMADGGLSAALIEAAVEARPQDLNDAPEIEEVMRPVWPVELLGDGSAGSGPVVVKGTFNPKWTFKNPEGWIWWIYNISSSDAMTTGGIVTIITKHFGVWVT